MNKHIRFLSSSVFMFLILLATASAADTTAPTGSISINNNAVYTNSLKVTLNLSATDSSGLSRMQFSNNSVIWSTPEAYATTKSWVLTSGLGTKKAYVKFKDNSGNWSKAYSDAIILDTTAPTGKILINNNAGKTFPIRVTLNLSAADIGSGVAGMKFSNNNSTWSAPEPYTAVKAWALTSGFGSKTVYVKYKDNAGNWSNAYFGSIYLSNQAPQIGNILPVSGGSGAGQSAVFTTTFSDANGWQDIKEAYFLINTAINGANCFYGYYDRNSNKFYLRNDTNTIWLGGYLPGSAKIIENSYAALDCSKAAVSGLAETLTLKWAITFKAASIGAKKAYLSVKDNANASSGWAQKGTWDIKASNKPPQITSILPDNNSVFLAGAKINIQTNASDPDNDPLQYQFSIGGTVKQTWSSANTYIWQTSSADKGAVSITCEVKDSNSNLTSKTISIRILDPTTQEILKKVADNYAKISDFSADMTLSSTLDAKPFGATDYCRYYFQAPNKEKTETFNDSTRKVKTEIVIVDKSTMYFIDPVNKNKEQVDLLSDTGVSSDQFNQMDIYYNLDNFLKNHDVTRDDFKTDFNNMIVVINAAPKIKNDLYSRIEIYVDYAKGLIVKMLHYKNDELPQILEALGSRKMANGAWVVNKVRKNPNFTAGNLMVTLVYENIKINSGLSDVIFDPTKQY